MGKFAGAKHGAGISYVRTGGRRLAQVVVSKAFHPFPDEERQRQLPIIPLVTEPGDATVHFGCGLHSGPGPTGHNARRTIYLQHYNARAFDLIGPYSGYNEIMPGYGEGQIKSVEEIQAG